MGNVNARRYGDGYPMHHKVVSRCGLDLVIPSFFFLRQLLNLLSKERQLEWQVSRQLLRVKFHAIVFTRTLNNIADGAGDYLFVATLKRMVPVWLSQGFRPSANSSSANPCACGSGSSKQKRKCQVLFIEFEL